MWGYLYQLTFGCSNRTSLLQFTQFATLSSCANQLLLDVVIGAYCELLIRQVQPSLLTIPNAGWRFSTQLPICFRFRYFPACVVTYRLISCLSAYLRIVCTSSHSANNSWVKSECLNTDQRQGWWAPFHHWKSALVLASFMTLHYLLSIVWLHALLQQHDKGISSKNLLIPRAT